jgi:hypothetical protein
MPVPNGYNPTFEGGITLGSTDTAPTTRVYGQIYSNQTGSTVQVLKVHNHDTTSGIGSYEGKADTASTSGAFYGLWQDANIGATGTGSATAILGVATVEATKTVTGGTLIGTYGQVRADGTVAGSALMAGLYGLVEEGGGAITASHVASAWLDSHRNTAVTGSHQLLYMTNNGSATMDEAIYVYGGDKITSLFELNTCGGMVGDKVDADIAFAHYRPVKVTIDGLPGKIYIEMDA